MPPPDNLTVIPAVEIMEKEYLRYSDISTYDKLDMAVDNLLSINPAIRPLDNNNKSGGLLEFSEEDYREFILVGDLHGNTKNLRGILQDEQNLYKLKRDEAVLIILGDAFHRETIGKLHEVESSIAMLDIIVRLINEYPANVYYILGNHDTFSERLSKNGIQQGVLFRNSLYRKRGHEYMDLMQEFFDSLPVFVKHKNFLAVHAGPARGGITRENIINIRSHPNLLWQLTWNRLNETRSYPSKKEYGPYDLDRMRMMLQCDPNIPVIVGHNPMWKISDEDSIWINLLNTTDHVILYSNHEKICTYVSFNNSNEFCVKHAHLKEKKQKFLLGDY